MIKTKMAWFLFKNKNEIINAVTENEFKLNHDDLKNSW